MQTGPGASVAAVMWGLVGIGLVSASRAPSRALPPSAVRASRAPDGESRATGFLGPLGFDQVPAWSWEASLVVILASSSYFP